jgi:hypothetical protein
MDPLKKKSQFFSIFTSQLSINFPPFLLDLNIILYLQSNDLLSILFPKKKFPTETINSFINSLSSKNKNVGPCFEKRRHYGVESGYTLARELPVLGSKR